MRCFVSTILVAFFVSHTSAKSMVSVGCTQVNCLVNPCISAMCPRDSGAVCKPNYCGGSCDFDFFSNGEKLTRRQCILDFCPLSHNLFCDKTEESLCAANTCRNHPQAICRKDCYCTAVFHDPVTLLQYDDCNAVYQL
ncbi:uncharacterized protein LOC100183851 [Ciona intestinalis]